MDSFGPAKGFELDTCENVSGDGMPEPSPLSDANYRWPLRDISNLFSFEVGDAAFEVEPAAPNTPGRQSDVENSPPSQRTNGSPQTPAGCNKRGSGNSSCTLRRGFR